MKKIFSKDDKLKIARVMADDAYAKEIDSVRDKMNYVASREIERVTPSEIIEVINKYPSYFGATYNVYVKVADRGSLKVTADFLYPSSGYCATCHISDEVFSELLQINEELIALIDKRSNLRLSIVETLDSFPSIKATIESFPEVVKYIPSEYLVEEKKPLVRNIDTLRKIFQNLKKED